MIGLGDLFHRFFRLQQLVIFLSTYMYYILFKIIGKFFVFPLTEGTLEN
jgi:hypothetical protein